MGGPHSETSGGREGGRPLTSAFAIAIYRRYTVVIGGLLWI